MRWRQGDLFGGGCSGTGQMVLAGSKEPLLGDSFLSLSSWLLCILPSWLRPPLHAWWAEFGFFHARGSRALLSGAHWAVLSISLLVHSKSFALWIANEERAYRIYPAWGLNFSFWHLQTYPLYM